MYTLRHARVNLNPHCAVSDTTINFLAGMCIAVACAIVVPGQPESVILTTALIGLWYLTVRGCNQPPP